MSNLNTDKPQNVIQSGLSGSAFTDNSAANLSQDGDNDMPNKKYKKVSVRKQASSKNSRAIDKKGRPKKYINREISWLEFNARVLQEAADPTVPLINRLQFLGIFSNNQDEFFRVRVATLRRITAINKEARIALGFSPKKVLKQIQKIVVKQRQQFENIYDHIVDELAKHKIFIINELEVTPHQGKLIRNYFHTKVRPLLVPLMVDEQTEFPVLKDGSIYLAVRLSNLNQADNASYCLIELPTDKISRFFVLEKYDDRTYIMLLDDVVRYCLNDIFGMFGYNDNAAYTIKITKDAETDVDTDVSKSFLELIAQSLEQRKHGQPTRFIHDEEIAPDLLDFIVRKSVFSETDHIIPAGRYHNFKDFMSFPKLNNDKLLAAPLPPSNHPLINPLESIFSLIKRQDVMVHVPYQTFNPIIDLLREAAIDPQVKSIKVTLYRVAAQSNIINALINAKRNGKEVTAVIELQARFDEAANIEWARTLQEVGIKVIHGQPGRKIHSKLILISRIEKGQMVRYAHVGTGNFHEGTAKIYTDISLLTSHAGITNDLSKVFTMIEKQKVPEFQHLLVSPYHMKTRIFDMIDVEIANAKAGKPAYIIAKMNSLNDEGMIDKLYEAATAGVELQFVVRGICSLVPSYNGLQDKIKIVSIVDQFLEHTRAFIFANGGNGKERYFIGSADWMERNLHRRIEVVCPVYDPRLQEEMRIKLAYQLADNVKARLVNSPKGVNSYQKNNLAPLRSQYATYNYFKALVE